MAVAKRTRIGERRYTVKDFQTGRKIKVECEACYNEEGSYACIRPSHDPYKSAHTTVTVVQDDEDIVDKEVLATAIIQICNAAQKLYNSGLNRKAVIALIADDTKLGKGTIDTVLSSLVNLRKTYTTK